MKKYVKNTRKDCTILSVKFNEDNTKAVVYTTGDCYICDVDNTLYNDYLVVKCRRFCGTVEDKITHEVHGVSFWEYTIIIDKENSRIVAIDSNILDEVI